MTLNFRCQHIHTWNPNIKLKVQFSNVKDFVNILKIKPNWFTLPFTCVKCLHISYVLMLVKKKSFYNEIQSIMWATLHEKMIVVTQEKTSIWGFVTWRW